MIQEIIDRVLANWEFMQPGRPRPRQLRYAVQSRTRVIVFLFDADAGSSLPVAIAKVSRSPDGNALGERSVKLMQRVRAQLNEPLRRTIPEALMVPPVAGLSCALETVLPGNPMHVVTSWWKLSRNTTRNLEAFARWLRSFQRQVVTGAETLDQAVLEKRVFDPLQSCLEADSVLRQRLVAIGRRVQGREMPLVWSYGDAHPSNILLHNGRVVGVVDWEGAASNEWPVFDWFQFTLAYALEFEKKQDPSHGLLERGRSALNMLLARPSSAVSRIVQERTVQFLSTYGFDADDMPLLYAAFLARLFWHGSKPAFLKHALPLLSELG